MKRKLTKNEVKLLNGVGCYSYLQDKEYKKDGKFIFKPTTDKVEKLFGVPPEDKPYRDTFTVHKSAKKGNSSFKITKTLLDTLLETQKQIGKNPRLIISIQDYVLTCDLRKNNENM